MLFLYTLAIFLAAALLFLVQPMAAKLVLPLLGGSPAVWNTTMVFFQSLLLLGYFYSHLVTKKLPRPAQGLVHASVIAAAALTLPIALPQAVAAPGPADSPALWLLLLLPIVAGAPFFVLTTTGPLLQSWFAASNHPRAKDPYFLYAASNTGSFVGLLSFPFFLEPRFSIPEQSAWFSRGYFAFAALVALCFFIARPARTSTSGPAPATPDLHAPSITWPRRLLWLALAAVPSSLSLGVTQTITTDIAPVPLLWVVPLSIYLLTFVLAFSPRFPFSSSFAGKLLIPASLAVIATRFLSNDFPNDLAILAHLFMLFAGALSCHRRLAELRPAAHNLTEFYLWLALGGVAGGLFNALLAPLAFNASLEYPIAIAAACCLIPSRRGGLDRRTILFGVLASLLLVSAAVVAIQYVAPSISPASVPNARFLTIAVACALLLLGPPGGAIRFGVAAMVAFVAALLISRQQSGELIYVERTFFGIHEIYHTANLNKLQHGNTVHGMQVRTDALRRTPVTYYHPDGPLGDLFRWKQLPDTPISVAGVGLGAGSIAAYTRDRDTLTFFEIDPAVATIATNPDLFSFIADAKGKVDIVLADGRLGVTRDPRTFDLIILDAFSSDAVPLHLLTREALASYRSRLKPHGPIVFHISSRFLNLAPVISATVSSLDQPFTLVSRDDSLTLEESNKTGRYPSTWLVAAARADLDPLLTTSKWSVVPPPASMRPWTDSYSSIWSALAPAINADAAPHQR
ncbi:MAG: fused MFS/spermidine synthase [Phycisphaerales bacterium]|nr:fused MFS/spermidine synthase [Phycisphaerales bacterium]